jgi:hypothetical protein
VIPYGDPALSTPAPQGWFDTMQFKILPAYKPRTNPLQYPGEAGPIYWEIQAKLAKNSNLTEKVRRN